MERGLGLDPGTLPHYRYRWVTPEELGEEPSTTPNTVGLGGNRDAIAVYPHLDHELVHLIFEEQAGRGCDFFYEGIAEALEWAPEMLPSPPYYDPRPFLAYNRRDNGFTFYGVADGFTTYLLGTYGRAAFVELLRRCPYEADEAEIRGLFAELFGDLDEVVADYIGSDACPEEVDDPLLPYPCAAPEIPWLDEYTWAHTRALSCDDPDVFGGVSPGKDDAAYTSVTLTITEPDAYGLRVSGDPEARVLLRRCSPCPWRFASVVVGPEELYADTLAPGRYALTMYGRASAITLHGVTLTRYE
ncbi:MAG: hypothetical protein H6711_00400 [Myxococcales bacterium]|nr:hypothetical protein [Myxococcales bacterium]